MTNKFAPDLIDYVVDYPGELGLDPAKFPSWRESQKEIINKVLNWALNPKRKGTVFMLEAPTGVGKSVIAAAIMLSMHHIIGTKFKGVITTTTRALQTQYIDDTLESHAKSAWGRQGHECLITPPGTSVEEAPCSFGYKCDLRTTDCTYYKERDSAHLANIAVLNSAFYLHCVNRIRTPRHLMPSSNAQIVGAEKSIPNLFQDATLTIHDEAHLLEGTVKGMVEAKLNKKFFKTIGHEMPDTSEYAEWEAWIEEVTPPLQMLSSTYSSEAIKLARDGAIPDDSVGRQAVRMQREVQRLTYELMPTHPLISIEQHTVSIRPIWGRYFGRKLLFERSQLQVLMSATIPDPEYLADTLGLSHDQWTFTRMPNPFHPMTRRIEYIPIMAVTGKTTDQAFGKIVAAADDILDNHLHEKVIMHSVSYARATLILAHSRHAKRMITHTRRLGAKQEAIEKYLAAPPGAILVSPSVGLGEDFGRGENCRAQIFLKYPIPYLGDPVIRARMEQNGNSLWIEADMAFIQAVGRGTRSADDYCVNYVLDKQAAKRLHKLPESIQEAIIRR